MSVPLTINGATFNYPVNNDTNWGVDATGWAQAVTSGMLQKAGGNFPLTADANFGPTFGLISPYYKSTTSTVASSGIVRLAKTDSIDWRNNANSADNILAVNGSDQLTFNGTVISTGSVTSIIGTANEIIASSPTGNVTLSTPQPIATTSSPTFASLTLTSPLSVANGGTGTTTPSLIAGTNVTITGSWPDQTVNATSGVNPGNVGQIAWYASTGSTVSQLSSLFLATTQELVFSTGLGVAQLQLAGNVEGQISFHTNSSGFTSDVHQSSDGNLHVFDIDNSLTWLTFNKNSNMSAGVSLDMGSHKITSVTQGTTTGDAISYPVSTAQLSANAVTQAVASGSTGGTDLGTTIATRSITTSGGAVLIMASANLQTTTGGSGAQVTAVVTRGGTAITGNQSQYFYSPAATIVNETVSIVCVDTPAAGSYTYNFTCAVTSGSGSTPTVNMYSIVLVELKR
jgi:hypothetical protein